MEHQNNPYADILKRHFEPSFEMVSRLVSYCPDGVWCEPADKAPFWQHIYHTVYYIDFWFRDEYSGAEFRSMTFDKDVAYDLGTKSGDILSKNELTAYLEKIAEKVERFFGRLTDETLLTPIAPQQDRELIYADTVLMQIRHIQYHVGHCNRLLRQYGSRTVGWIGYHEN